MTLHRAIAKTAAETTLAEQFASLANPDSDRVAAFAAFADKGLPSRRDEAWHYTDLRSAMASAAPLAPPPDADRISAAREMLAARKRVGDLRLAIVDGRYVPQLSDPAPAGLLVGTLAKFAPSGRASAIVALNDAFASNGLSLIVDAGVDLKERIEIVHCAHAEAPQSAYSRLSITLLAGAKARIVECFVAAGPAYQRNAVTRASLNASAMCSLVTIVEDDASLHVETQIADLGADAEFNAFALVAGCALARRELMVRHEEAGAKIALAGLALIDGRRHADATLEVVHAAPEGQSREFFRTIVADEGTGVFQGKVVVRPGAQKSDGAMKSQAILLSPQAAMNNKPELEILADDVVCGHGATVGALDPEQVFYLQTRGLPRSEAEAMLLEAFAGEAIARVDEPEFAQILLSMTRAWLAGRAGAAPA
jgi:Fe-S cluster assembly protein SufD